MLDKINIQCPACRNIFGIELNKSGIWVCPMCHGFVVQFRMTKAEGQAPIFFDETGKDIALPLLRGKTAIVPPTPDNTAHGSRIWVYRIAAHPVIVNESGHEVTDYKTTGFHTVSFDEKQARMKAGEIYENPFTGSVIEIKEVLKEYHE